MCILSFRKIAAKQNILFDEFFTEKNQIDILAFNYDGKGSALCLADGSLSTLDSQNLEKIMFGINKSHLINYLKSIFDPNVHSDELHKAGDDFIFRSAELSALKKYDIYNLAKQILKDFEQEEAETFIYFSESKCSCAGGEGQASKPSANADLFGNVNSLVFHKSTCKSFNSSSCTAPFSSREEAVAAGYKPCGSCKP